MKIKNKNYRKFLDNGVIDLVTLDQLEAALNNVKGVRGQYIKEGRALLIALYWTGARPVEILLMKAKDIQLHEKHKTLVSLHLKTAKRGNERKILIPKQRKFMKELYTYSKSIFPEMFMFKHYENRYVRHYTDSRGNSKQHIDTTDKIRYYVSKWFTGVIEDSITPYFLRHSRFSSMSEYGADPIEIKHYKGSKKMSGVEPYLHLSSKRMVKTARRVK